MIKTNICITVSYGLVYGEAKKYTYYQPAKYMVTQLKTKPVLVWKYCYHIGRARRSYRLAEQDALEFCEKHNYKYIPDIRNGRNVFKPIHFSDNWINV